MTKEEGSTVYFMNDDCFNRRPASQLLNDKHSFSINVTRKLLIIFAGSARRGGTPAAKPLIWCKLFFVSNDQLAGGFALELKSYASGDV